MLLRVKRAVLAVAGRILYRWRPAVRRQNFRRYDRFPMGKGHAPGIATGLGVSGAGGWAAGWAARALGAEDRCGTAGFFLAAFFLADFSVGFFLAAPFVRDGFFRTALFTRAAFFFFATLFPRAFLPLAMRSPLLAF